MKGRVATEPGRRSGARAVVSAAGSWARAGVAALALAGMVVTAASASDVVTVNNTEQYVDPSIAAEFITIPNLCTEPIGTQGTSVPACSALGVAAVTAAQGIGPDVYFEPHGSHLQAKNAFVPGNGGPNVGATGYSQIFSQHKYDLFGRSGDRMGPYTREEHLFLTLIAGVSSGGGITNGQTTPGEDTLLKFIAYLLYRPQGAGSFSDSGLTFQIANLPTYERVTGFTTGQRTVVHNWCLANIPPLLQPALCSPGVDAETYARVNYPEVAEASCGPAGYFDCVNRDQWIDQVVVGYVKSWDVLGGDLHFAQNFRSQMGYDPTAILLDSNTAVLTDFRLEQSVELSGAFSTDASDPTESTLSTSLNLTNQDFIAGRQTFQSAVTTKSNQDNGWLYNKKQAPTMGQLVSQDVNGYFFSCFNCDNPDQDISHVFTPPITGLHYMPYHASWNTVPTVTHASP